MEQKDFPCSIFGTLLQAKTRGRQNSGSSVAPEQNALRHVDRETSVLDASKVMRMSHSTELLVVDGSRGLPFVFGILTAIDIVTRVIATGLDPAVLTAGDIAWSGIPDRTPGS